MKNLVLLLSFIVGSFHTFAQEKTFQVFTSSGKKVKVAYMFNEVQKSQVVIFGELHNNPISHWFELKLYKNLYAKDSNVVLSLEMFERDNQFVLNRFVEKEISRKQLDTLARLWKNFDTDYLPLIRFAQEKKLPVLASNVTRSIAYLVYKNNFSVLDTITEKQNFAQLPILYDSTVACYRNISSMAHHGGSFYLAQAQALKDATMAESILLQLHSKSTHLLHLNGAYHSENKEGVCWYLQKMNPTLKFATITTVLQKDLSKLEKENIGKADFIVVVDEEMITTY